MGITRIESVTFGVQDLAMAKRYFEDFGLAPIESGEYGALFRTVENQTVQLRSLDDSGLPPATGAGSTLRETIWGVETAADLDAIAAELTTDRSVRMDAAKTLHSIDDSGFAIGFRVAQETPLQSEPQPANVAGFARRVNAPLDPIGRIAPLRIVHVVFQILKAGHERAAAFYLDRLRFRLSDRSVDAGDFMRCERSLDHHNLLLLHRSDSRSYNHIAFEVRGIDEIMLGGLYMKQQGWKPTRRPGRHFLGSNLHWFFESPCGGRTEYVADMDRLDENWAPRIFEKHPGESIWLFSAD
jgi:catechol 2,3-dioxygenase-like lactoylglutathione lyase family enzyme